MVETKVKQQENDVRQSWLRNTISPSEVLGFARTDAAFPVSQNLDRVLEEFTDIIRLRFT
jgi:hypothetical protein